ncbi:hypothetical protein [Streptomyces sp. SP18CS02]|uniref:hypothetical protein n=1 Tax=Streptomyces sp. SP18CS02 TaxID=3002531 RepID=UPI002E76DC1B|nr:hypothetical protein [Streptomyces sp. SP18CS02]MEE1754846.1 hypothetical protein [Streptomyces sp. SP18CS02]
MTENAVEKARKAAETAAAKLAEAEAAEDARLAQIAAERAERAREYDRDLLSRWTEIAAEARDSEGDRDLEYDPNTMPFLEGLIRFAAGREKRRIVLQAAQNAESTLEIPVSQCTVPVGDRIYSVDVAAELTRIVESEVNRRVTDFAEAFEAKRNRAIDGEA